MNGRGDCLYHDEIHSLMDMGKIHEKCHSIVSIIFEAINCNAL